MNKPQWVQSLRKQTSDSTTERWRSDLGCVARTNANNQARSITANGTTSAEYTKVRGTSLHRCTEERHDTSNLNCPYAPNPIRQEPITRLQPSLSSGHVLVPGLNIMMAYHSHDRTGIVCSAKSTDRCCIEFEVFQEGFVGENGRGTCLNKSDR